jgi:hypothetical protein
MIKSGRIRLKEGVARNGDKSKKKILIGKPKGKKHFWKT